MQHALNPLLLRLIETLALSESERRQIRELIEANQPQLALEWITDAAAQQGLANDPSLRQLLLQLGTQLGDVQAIRDRLG